ncbi:hypothetical protein HK102_013375 [Quaeritorhiza haematococci]|nr:hypothetical protein HK102_013375 [Quaeritorhiza haematococci]
MQRAVAVHQPAPAQQQQRRTALGPKSAIKNGLLNKENVQAQIPTSALRSKSLLQKATVAKTPALQKVKDVNAKNTQLLNSAKSLKGEHPQVRALRDITNQTPRQQPNSGKAIRKTAKGADTQKVKKLEFAKKDSVRKQDTTKKGKDAEDAAPATPTVRIAVKSTVKKSSAAEVENKTSGDLKEKFSLEDLDFNFDDVEYMPPRGKPIDVLDPEFDVDVKKLTRIPFLGYVDPKVVKAFKDDEKYEFIPEPIDYTISDTASEEDFGDVLDSDPLGLLQPSTETTPSPFYFTDISFVEPV